MTITDRTKFIYKAIRGYHASTGEFPTLRDIMPYVGLTSTHSVYKHVKKLEDVGAIKKKKGHITWINDDYIEALYSL